MVSALPSTSRGIVRPEQLEASLHMPRKASSSELAGRFLMARKDGTMRPRMLALVALGALWIRSGRKIRHWYLRWGATDEELTRSMPMDEHAPFPKLSSTMAITIDAPPEKVWPWLVQIGEPPRAGYYSYTTIERL